MRLNLGTRYESNFVCLTKVLSQKRLSEDIPYESYATPQARVKNGTNENQPSQISMRTKWF